MRTAALLLPIFLAASATAQTPAATVPVPALAGQPRVFAAAISADRTFILDTMRVLGAPGASVTVIKDGAVVWSEGFGWADMEQRVAVTPLTKFRIGSVSKSLTSIALGLLVQEGKLDLDAPIQRYVPAFPQKQAPITLRELAGHIAGIRHYRGNEMLIQRHYATVTEALDIFQNDTLLFTPGTRFSYSSYGFNLLSAAMERAAGEPFVQLMSQRVFEPMGLRHTVAEYPDSLIPFRAHFYTPRRLRQWHRQRTLRGQQLQVGWRRLPLHDRGPGTRRATAARWCTAEDRDATAALDVPAHDRRQGNGVRHGSVHGPRFLRPATRVP